jgi:hypothetical protein
MQCFHGTDFVQRTQPTHPVLPFFQNKTSTLSRQLEASRYSNPNFLCCLTSSSAQPHLVNLSHHITTTTERDFLTCLKSTVLGISSQLHTWDLPTEMFVKAGDEQTRILVDGKDDVVSTRWVLFFDACSNVNRFSSFLARFLTIGTLLRRLELLLYSLRTRYV